MELEPGEVYSIVIGSIALLLILFRLLHSVPGSCTTGLRRFFLAYLVYARLDGRLRYIQPEPWSYFVIQFSYFAGTAVANILGVHTASEASSRAATLALVNMIPLYMSGHEFGARLLGLSLRAYCSLHRTMGLMAFLQVLVHVILTLRYMNDSMDKDAYLYGLLVRLP